MKTTIRENPPAARPCLMRDTRDGQIVLVTENHIFAMTTTPNTEVGQTLQIEDSNLAPFTGSLTLSN